MLALLVAVALTQTPQHRLFQQPNLPRQSAPSYAFFEFAPASGAGMTAACACTTPTGAKGEAMTFTRASSATCLKGGTTTGIADGDMVTCSSNQPRVMPGGDGTGGVGLLVEGARTNSCLRSEEICNAAWSDVGTPSCSADQATGPFGTQTMDQLTDNDGAAFEGRTQSIATTSATVHSVSCFVKAGTATAASITLVGTGSSTGDCTGTATGLSATTSTRVTCSSAAAYAGTLTAVAITIRVGTVVGDQGTLLVEGCQHEVSAAFPSSYISTAGATATRADETATFPSPGAAIEAAGCGGATMVPSWSGTSAALNMGLVTFASAGRPVYVRSSGGAQFTTFDGTNNPNIAATFTAGTAIRGVGEWSGSSLVIRNVTAGTSASSPFDGTMEAGTIELGNAAAFAGRLFSVIKRVVIDPSPTRCR